MSLLPGTEGPVTGVLREAGRGTISLDFLLAFKDSDQIKLP